MAGFRTHITTSTVLGIGYGMTGYFVYGVHEATCMLGAGLCGLSGMLPDLDSDTGVPLRESVAFGAAVVPMLLVDRLREMRLSTDLIVLAGALIYIAIRFGLAEVLKRYTVHRGMWHSIPAAAIAGLFAYLVCTDPYVNGVYAATGYDEPDYSTESYFDEEYFNAPLGPVAYRSHGLFEKMFKVIAVVLGFMSHLLLDEFYSIEARRGSVRLKRSFGTAIKFYSKSTWANVSTYGKLALLIALIAWMSFHDAQSPSWDDFRSVAQHWVDGWRR